MNLGWIVHHIVLCMSIVVFLLFLCHSVSNLDLNVFKRKVLKFIHQDRHIARRSMLLLLNRWMDKPSNVLVVLLPHNNLMMVNFRIWVNLRFLAANTSLGWRKLMKECLLHEHLVIPLSRMTTTVLSLKCRPHVLEDKALHHVLVSVHRLLWLSAEAEIGRKCAWDSSVWGLFRKKRSILSWIGKLANLVDLGHCGACPIHRGSLEYRRLSMSWTHAASQQALMANRRLRMKCTHIHCFLIHNSLHLVTVWLKSTPHCWLGGSWRELCKRWRRRCHLRVSVWELLMRCHIKTAHLSFSSVHHKPWINHC